MIKIKRIYEESSPRDGYRILIDRLWPRGLAKEKARVDLWLKEIAPSEKLRKWFSHDPKKWPSFVSKYKEELKIKKDLIGKIKEIEKEKRTITFLYSAKDQAHNNAIVLNQVLKN